ncbi:hypothetical protein [Lentibacillus salinarum]|uniref:Permease n=1 Tax=Lentibacillus salinarum TaxID=446820 RepID=A0ABW3ZU58_9BACI
MSKKKKINNKTREYLHGGIMVLIIILLIVIFDLPKTPLITLAIVIPVVIFLHEVFPHKSKGGRKREYLTAILFFAVFAVFILIFDLPKKLYIVMGVLAVSDVLLYEVFDIKDNENNT